MAAACWGGALAGCCSALAGGLLLNLPVEAVRLFINTCIKLN